MKKVFTIFLLLALIGLSNAYSQKTNIDSGLVAYYPFNGNANDESGNGNNGTVYGASLSIDRFGQANKAYSFNGINNYIEVLNSNSLNFGSSIDFTFCAWIKYSSQNVPDWYFVPIFYKRYDNPLPPIGYGLGVIYNKGASEIHTSIGTLGGDNGLIGTSLINNDQWHLLNLVVTRANYNVKIYVDAHLETDLNNSILGATVDNISNLFIGTTNAGASSDRFFNGLIDDIRIFNRSLNEAEIQQLYNENGWLAIPSFSKSELNIDIYPNPTNEKVYIKSEKTLQIKAYNFLGEQIFTGNSNDCKYVTLRQKGIYMFEFTSDKNTIYKKVVVQ